MTTKSEIQKIEKQILTKKEAYTDHNHAEIFCVNIQDIRDIFEEWYSSQ